MFERERVHGRSHRDLKYRTLWWVEKHERHRGRRDGNLVADEVPNQGTEHAKGRCEPGRCASKPEHPWPTVDRRPHIVDARFQIERNASKNALFTLDDRHDEAHECGEFGRIRRAHPTPVDIVEHRPDLHDDTLVRGAREQPRHALHIARTHRDDQTEPEATGKLERDRPGNDVKRDILAPDTATKEGRLLDHTEPRRANQSTLAA